MRQIRQITVDQSHQVVATLIANTDWSQIDFEKLGLQESIIRNPQEAGRQFTAFLKNGGRMTTPDFPIWKTITIGNLKTVEQARQALTDNNCRISEWASDMLKQDAFTLAQEQSELNLVILSVAELGFPKGANCADICQRAKEYGLALCPPEVGVELRLQYKDQPKGEGLSIAMETITDSEGYLMLFYVGRSGDVLRLASDDGQLGHHRNSDSRFVFVSRK